MSKNNIKLKIKRPGGLFVYLDDIKYNILDEAIEEIKNLYNKKHRIYKKITFVVEKKINPHIVYNLTEIFDSNINNITNVKSFFTDLYINKGVKNFTVTSKFNKELYDDIILKVELDNLNRIKIINDKNNNFFYEVINNTKLGKNEIYICNEYGKKMFLLSQAHTLSFKNLDIERLGKNILKFIYKEIKKRLNLKENILETMKNVKKLSFSFNKLYYPPYPPIGHVLRINDVLHIAYKNKFFVILNNITNDIKTFLTSIGDKIETCTINFPASALSTEDFNFIRKKTNKLIFVDGLNNKYIYYKDNIYLLNISSINDNDILFLKENKKNIKNIYCPVYYSKNECTLFNFNIKTNIKEYNYFFDNIENFTKNISNTNILNPKNPNNDVFSSNSLHTGFTFMNLKNNFIQIRNNDFKFILENLKIIKNFCKGIKFNIC